MTSIVPFLGHLVAIPKVVLILNSKGMELKINNQIKQFEAESLSVQDLLDLEIPNKQNGIAVAINNSVIPKTNWNSYPIQQTDEILIISATQGG